jgi:hypothetical protein
MLEPMSLRGESVRILNCNVRRSTITIVVAFFCTLALTRTAAAIDVETKGSIDASKSWPLVAFSTDFVIQQVLSDAIQGAGRSLMPGESEAITLTVNSHQKLLKPGVSLGDLFPGDPEVAEMLRNAGIAPPPLGDTGEAQADPYAALARDRAMNPDASPSQQIQQMQRMNNYYNNHGPSPYDNIPASQLYDTVVIARAVLSKGTGQMLLVAVVHPNESIKDARKLIALKIADAVLH